MANDTISQIKIGNTTYDICDAETKRNSGYAIEWKRVFDDAYDSSHYKTVDANTSVSLGYLFSGITEGSILGDNDQFTVDDFEYINSVSWPYMSNYPCFYQITLHTISTANNYSYRIVLQTDSEIMMIHTAYIKQTSDTVSVFSGFIPYNPSIYEIFVSSDTKLSKVWGNASLLIYKTALKYPFTSVNFDPVQTAEEQNPME